MNKNLIKSRFSRASDSYLNHAKIQGEIGARLSERFDYYTLTPSNVLDLGAGPGLFSHQLKARYPKSQVTAFDLSESMLKKIKKKWRKPLNKVMGDLATLPFKDDAFDVIFANQVIHWIEDKPLLFKEIFRILNPKGVFVFSTLGPDTFKEIKEAWKSIDAFSHVNHFDDMHVLGDVLLASNFNEPVMDMEYITLRYSTTKSMAKDLKYQGVSHVSPTARKGLMTPRLWQKFTNAYEKFRDEAHLLPLTYEVLYGQAWGKELKQSINSKGEVIVPLSTLLRR